MFNVSILQIRVIDSFNFSPMALAKLPDAFQLEFLAKGYFPHFFTSKENLNYVGPYPPLRCMDPMACPSKVEKSFTGGIRKKSITGKCLILIAK